VDPAQLVDAVRQALQAAVQAGELTVAVPEEITVDRPRSREHGDYATPVALKLGKIAGRPPREIAAVIGRYLEQAPGIDSVEVAGPGFLNITLLTAAAGALVGQIVQADAGYGHGSALDGKKVNLEFVSANPTGPVHIGGARWAAVGDALGRVLSTQGADVVREYYFNDAGAQIDRFARSLLATARGEPTPEDGYAGDYIGEIAGRITAEHPGAEALPGSPP
jgi:arginyl-tRNA synthetase